MAERTLKETYELHKKSQYEKVLKFMESVSVTQNGIFSDPKKVLQISESIETMEKIAEIAKPLVPSLQLFLNKNSTQLNEGYKKEDSLQLKQTLYRYAALSEFFKNLPKTIQEKEDFYVAYKNSIAGSLLEESDFEKVADELAILSENKLMSFSNTFPEFPLILGQRELNEAVRFLSNDIGNLYEQNTPNLNAMLQAVNTLNTLLNSLDLDPNTPNDQELPNVKKGLRDLVAMVQQVTANAKTGLFGANEEKVIAQVRTAIGMLQQLADKWDAISQIMDNQLKIIEKRSESEFDVGGLEKNPDVQKAIGLVKNAIIRNISIAGSGGFFSNLLRRYKGQNIYPKTLTPQIVANDVISLLSKEVAKPPKEAEKQPQQPPATAPEGQGTAGVAESRKQKRLVLESIDDLKNALNRLGDALKQISPTTKKAAIETDKVAKEVSPPGAAEQPAAANQPAGTTVATPPGQAQAGQQTQTPATPTSTGASAQAAQAPAAAPAGLDKPVPPPGGEQQGAAPQIPANKKVKLQDLEKFVDTEAVKKVAEELLSVSGAERNLVVRYLLGK